MLLHAIERFLRQHDMPPTTFGRASTRDPRLVFDLRVRRRVEHFMNTYRRSISQ